MSTLTIKQLETESDLQNFHCGVQSIDDQIADSYFVHIIHKKKAYKICFYDSIVGAYQLSFGHFSLADTKVPFNDYGNGDGQFGILWIDYLAIREELQGKGIGKTILTTILKDAEALYRDWPIRVIVIDALPDRVDWYLRMGFDFIKDKEHSCFKYGTLRMFFDLMPERDKQQVSEYCEKNIE